MEEFSGQRKSKINNLSRKLAEYGSLANFDSPPEHVIHEFKKSLLDYLCIPIGESRTSVRKRFGLSQDI